MAHVGLTLTTVWSTAEMMESLKFNRSNALEILIFFAALEAGYEEAGSRGGCSGGDVAKRGRDAVALLLGIGEHLDVKLIVAHNGVFAMICSIYTCSDKSVLWMGSFSCDHVRCSICS